MARPICLEKSPLTISRLYILLPNFDKAAFSDWQLRAKSRRKTKIDSANNKN